GLARRCNPCKLCDLWNAASLARAAFWGKTRPFDPSERLFRDQEVGGSNPLAPTGLTTTSAQQSCTEESKGHPAVTRRPFSTTPDGTAVVPVPEGVEQCKRSGSASRRAGGTPRSRTTAPTAKSSSSRLPTTSTARSSPRPNSSRSWPPDG